MRAHDSVIKALTRIVVGNGVGLTWTALFSSGDLTSDVEAQLKAAVEAYAASFA